MGQRQSLINWRAVCSAEQNVNKSKGLERNDTAEAVSLFARDASEKLIGLDSRNDLSSLSTAASVLTVQVSIG